MKRPTSVILLAAGLLLPQLLGAVPLFLNYQGRITQSGVPVPDSPTNAVTLTIYDALTGGTNKWSETDNVATKNGLFSVELGHTTTLALPFDVPYWLEVNWAGTTMSPRQALVSAPYAYRAAASDSAVTASAAASLILPQSLALATGGSVLSVSNTANTAIQGKGGAVGVLGQPGSSGGSGVFADYAGVGGAYALSVSGPARFWGGAVSFTGGVDFSGATVTGLSGGVTAPLGLTSTTGAATIFAANTGSGPGLQVIGVNAGVSVTVSNGSAIYANDTLGGGGQVTILSDASGTETAVQGRNSTGQSTGSLGGKPNAGGPVGVYGTTTFNSPSGSGVQGEDYFGSGVVGTGINGVEGRVTMTGQTGVYANNQTIPGTLALKVYGPALFQAGYVSFTSAVDFTGATVTGLAVNVPIPLYLTGSSAVATGIISGLNLGAGFGVVGRNSLPGSQDAGGNPVTINAGVYGFTSSTNSAGVYGETSAVSSTAGVVGRGWSGVYGESTASSNGSGGEFKAVSGTGVEGQGVTGTAGRAMVPGGLGMYASDNNYGVGTLGLLVQGASQFNGPVNFNGSVNGLPGVNVPLNLTGTANGGILTAQNNGNGPGVSATAMVANAAGVQGENDVFNGLGLLGLSANGMGVAGFGATVGVSGTATGANGVAVYARDNSNLSAISAYNDGTGSTNNGIFGETHGGYGVYGFSLGANGVGVLGQGSIIGVQGVLNGTFGDAFNANVNSVGNAAYLVNTGGTGVFASGSTRGVQAGLAANAGDAFYASVSTTGNAANFNNNGAGPALNAVGNNAGTAVNVGNAGTGSALQGSASGYVFALNGSNTSGSGYSGGVRGDAGAGIGIFGNVGSGTALYGQASSGTAVFGQGQTHAFNAALYGNSGDAYSASISTTGYVADFQNNGSGGGLDSVIAGGSGGATAVWGQNSSSGGGSVGVRGSSYGASGLNYGIYGDAASASGVGVYGTNAGGGTAVQGDASGGGAGGVFNGLNGVVATGSNMGAVVVGGNGIGLSVTAGAFNAIFARSNANAIVGRTDATNGFGVQGIGYVNGPGVQGTVAAAVAGSQGVWGTNPAVGGIGVQGDNPEVTTGGGFGVKATASHAASIGLLASNVSTIGVVSAGAALYISGSVKTSSGTYTENASNSATWNVNAGAALSGGPAGSVLVGASYSESGLTTITFKHPMITASSVVLVTFSTQGPTTCAVRVNSSGVCTISTGSFTLSAGSGFNYLIIN